MARILRDVRQSNLRSSSYWGFANNCGGAFVAFRMAGLLVLLISRYRPCSVKRQSHPPHLMQEKECWDTQIPLWATGLNTMSCRCTLSPWVEIADLRTIGWKLRFVIGERRAPPLGKMAVKVIRLGSR